eukprot:15197306-Heterocapsa_arctica.AAC.1
MQDYLLAICMWCSSARDHRQSAECDVRRHENILTQQNSGELDGSVPQLTGSSSWIGQARRTPTRLCCARAG